METILHKLGERIQKERKLFGFTQEEFAQMINKTRRTVVNWENGLVNPSLDDLNGLCNLFKCDLDYLTGRLEEQTHDDHFICGATGLSEDAVKKLRSYKGTGNAALLSEMITHKEFDNLLVATNVAVDDNEQRWNNLSMITSYADFSDYKNEISNYIASKKFLQVVDGIREKVSKGQPDLMVRIYIMNQAKAIWDKVCRIFYEAETEEDLSNDLSEIDQLTESGRSKIVVWWQEHKDTLYSIGFSDWLQLLKPIPITDEITEKAKRDKAAFEKLGITEKEL